MPVTAKLSSNFYTKLGDDIANELVEWFNQVDATYRLELRDLFDVNFARIDARFEQRAVQTESRVEQRLAQFEAKFEQRLTQIESKFEQRLAQLEATLGQQMTQLEARLEGKMEQLRAELLKWMFLFWLGTAGTILALAAFLRR